MRRAGPPQHSLRRPFHRDLDEVRQTIARLSATVTEDILRATEILLTQDLDERERMIVADDELDAACRPSSSAATASWHSRPRLRPTSVRSSPPCGSSPRSSVPPTSPSTSAKTARRLYGHGLPPRIRGLDPPTWGSQASAAVPRGERGLPAQRRRPSRGDPPLDDLLDDLQRQFVAVIFDATDDIDLPTAVQLAMLARFYERIGDHAVTIGERVTYLVTGAVHTHCA